MRVREMFESVDLHVGGAPVRLVQSGYPDLGPGPMAARARRAAQAFDAHRLRLILEPWGAPGLEGAILTAPVRPDAAAGLVFVRAAGEPERSGRTALAAATWLWRAGRAGGAGGAGGVGGGGAAGRAGHGRVALDTPAGPVSVAVAGAGDAAPTARLANPGARVVAALTDSDASLVRVGGTLVCVALAAEGGAGLEAAALRSARARCAALKAAVAASAPGAGEVAEWVLAAAPTTGRLWAAVAFDAQGVLLRAPTFEALGALAAHLVRAGRIGRGERLAVRGLADAPVGLRVRALAAEGGDAVATEVQARAFVTAWRRFLVDPDDDIAPFLLP